MSKIKDFLNRSNDSNVNHISYNNVYINIYGSTIETWFSNKKIASFNRKDSRKLLEAIKKELRLQKITDTSAIMDLLNEYRSKDMINDYERDLFFEEITKSLKAKAEALKEDLTVERKTITHFNKAQRRFIKKALNNFEDSNELAFMTLTFAPNICDRKYTDARIKQFTKKLKRKYELKHGIGSFNRQVKYAYVIENQRRNSIHYHWLISCDYKKLEEINPIKLWLSIENAKWSKLTKEEKDKLDYSVVLYNENKEQFKLLSKNEKARTMRYIKNGIDSFGDDRANDFRKVKKDSSINEDMKKTMEEFGFKSENYALVLYMAKYFSKKDSGDFQTKAMVSNQRLFIFSKNCEEVIKKKCNLELDDLKAQMDKRIDNGDDLDITKDDIRKTVIKMKVLKKQMIEIKQNDFFDKKELDKVWETRYSSEYNDKYLVQAEPKIENIKKFISLNNRYMKMYAYLVEHHFNNSYKLKMCEVPYIDDTYNSKIDDLYIITGFTIWENTKVPKKQMMKFIENREKNTQKNK